MVFGRREYSCQSCFLGHAHTRLLRLVAPTKGIEFSGFGFRGWGIRVCRLALKVSDLGSEPTRKIFHLLAGSLHVIAAHVEPVVFS